MSGIGRKGGRSLRALVAVVIAGLLLTASASADEQAGFDSRLGPEPVNQAPVEAAVVFDLLILRPIGLVALAIGAAALLPAALLTAPNGRASVETALDLFVRAPMEDVFGRKLGDF